MDKEKYKFTEDWFGKMTPIWKNMFGAMSPVYNVLEIGCYEGRATTWICENVFNDTSGATKYNYDVIDTFGGSLEETGMKHVKDGLKKENFIEKNFLHNISFFPHVKFNVYKGYSQRVLPTFESKEKYDFIYIDASHTADDTFVDAYYACRLLKKGGFLIFDDYAWKDPKNVHPINSPKLGIDMFSLMYDSTFARFSMSPASAIYEYQVGFVKKGSMY